MRTSLSSIKRVVAAGVISFFLAGLPVGATCVDAPSGLIGWWRGEADAYDLISGNHGTLQGGVAFAAGKVGQAFRFDGINDFVRIPFAPVLNVGGQVTVEFWMKADADNAMLSCCQGLVTSDSYEIEVSGGGSQQVGINAYIATTGGPSGTTGDANGGGAPVSSNEWHHLAFTYDGSMLQLYIDGQSWGNPMPLGGPIAPMQNGSFLAFGSADGRLSCPSCINTRYFKGLIDEVAIYDRALQPYEIAAIFSADADGKCLLPPFIRANPTDVTAYVGGNGMLSTSVGGALPLNYQWQLNGTNLPGATTSTLSFTNFQISDAGTYALQATNSQGWTNSAEVNVTILVPPQCVSLPTGLVSWWRAENNAYDQLGNNNGTMQNGATFTDAPIGRAFKFPGSGSYVKIPQTPSLNLTNQLSIEFWMKADISNAMDTCCQGLVTSDYYGIIVGGGGPQQVGINAYISTTIGGSATTGDANGGGAVITSNEWHHIATTYDGTKLQLYIDGQPWGNPNFRTGTIPPMLPGSFVAIGSESGRSSCFSCANSRFFRGLIDDVGIYNRALSTGEISAIYNASVARKCVVSFPPAIVAQPISRTTLPGSNITFVAVANGTPPLYYQWKFNGADISSATNTTLMLTNVQPGKAGLYSVRVTNAIDQVVSSNATLKIISVFAIGNGQPLTNSAYSFAGPATLQLQSVFTNGTIFYTLDGSPPSFLSTFYGGSFMVSNTVTLRALAYSADFFQSGELDPIAISIAPQYSLSVSPASVGSVLLNPPGGTYFSNTMVTVTATPTGGWTFLQWLGDLAGTNNPASITVNRNQRVQAVFGTTLDATAAGNGSVTKIPPSALYPYGTVVALVAVPQAGSYFGIWGNAASGSVNPLYFTVTNAGQSVSSLFAPLSGGQSALTVIPNGFGRVTISPQANAYATGANVTLTAVPDAGQSFLGWAGDASGASNPLGITMTTSKVITANFSVQPRLTIAPPLDGLFPEGFRFTLNGEFGRNYQIESSSNSLAWPPLGIVTNTYNQVQLLVPMTNAPIRLLRALRLP